MKSHQEDELRGSAERLFKAGFQALLNQDMEGFVDMWAEDGSMEFPYQLPGFPQRLEGKSAIRAHMRDFPRMLHIDRLSEPVFHQTLNPEVMIVEFSCEGRAVATGEPYPQKYISVIETRGGRIVKYRDYWNPLIVQRALRPEEGGT